MFSHVWCACVHKSLTHPVKGIAPDIIILMLFTFCWFLKYPNRGSVCLCIETHDHALKESDLFHIFCTDCLDSAG